MSVKQMLAFDDGERDSAGEPASTRDPWEQELEIVLCGLSEATRFRSQERLLALARGPEGNLLRSNLSAHRELALALFYSVDADAALPELQCYLAALPPAGRQAAEARNLILIARAAEKKSSGCHAAVASMTSGTLPTVQVVVDGTEPATFVVDTGASNTLVSRFYAKSCHLEVIQGEDVHSSARNAIQLAISSAKEFSLGGVNLGPVSIRVGTLPAQLGVAGLLSPFNVLRGCWWELDFEHGRLTMGRGDSGRTSELCSWDKARLYWDRGNVFVRAQVDGEEGFFLLDSGAGGMILTPEFAKSIGIALSGQTIESVDITGTTTVQNAGMHSFTLGESRIDTNMYIGEFPVDAEDLSPITCSGFVGMPWFRRRHILVPPDQRHIYFEEATET